MTESVKVRPSRCVCMPVGPLGVRPATVQLLVALVRMRVVDALIMHAGHLIPARNKCWADAVRHRAERVLWLDADIYARPEDLVRFFERADAAFDAEGSKDAWIGAVCARRGGGWAMQTSNNPSQYALLLGLGLAYWDVERMIYVLGPEPELAFKWLPPFGEDYHVAAMTWDAGYRLAVDRALPTEHDDVGTWPGAHADGT